MAILLFPGVLGMARMGQWLAELQDGVALRSVARLLEIPVAFLAIWLGNRFGVPLPGLMLAIVFGTAIGHDHGLFEERS